MAKLKIEKDPKIDVVVNYLSGKYAQIRRWCEGRVVTDVETFEVVPNFPPAAPKIKLHAITNDQVKGVAFDTYTFTIAHEHFEIVKETIKKPNFQTLLDKLRTEPGFNNEKTVPKMPIQHKHKITFGEFDNTIVLRTKYQEARSGPLYGYSCACNDRFTCPKIVDLISTDDKWWRSIKKKKNDEGYWLFVPVFGLVLYKFFLEPRIIKDWTGTEQSKLIVEGVNRGETIFYDAPIGDIIGETRCLLLRDQIGAVHKLAFSVLEKYRQMLSDFLLGKSTFVCHGKTHSFNTSARFREFLRSTQGAPAASALTLELFDMCYICYQANVPAFYIMTENSL